MPEYLAILVVIAGLVSLATVLLIVAINKINRQIETHNEAVNQKIDLLAARLTAIEDGFTEHGRDLDAIRSEFALHFTARDNGKANYEQAIKAASSGVPFEEVSQIYGLREPEAKLLVAVYGEQ